MFSSLVPVPLTYRRCFFLHSSKNRCGKRCVPALPRNLLPLSVNPLQEFVHCFPSRWISCAFRHIEPRKTGDGITFSSRRIRQRDSKSLRHFAFQRGSCLAYTLRAWPNEFARRIFD